MNRLLAARKIFKSVIDIKKYKHTTSILQSTTPATAIATQNANFINGSSATYIEEVYEAWMQNPASVHKSWDIYFRTGSYQSPPTLGGGSQPNQQIQLANINDLLAFIQKNTQGHQTNVPLVAASPEEKSVDDHLRLYALIRAFQIRGHKLASLDPLGILNQDVTGEGPADLNIEHYNFTEADLKRKFKLPSTTFIGGQESQVELGEIMNKLKVCQSLFFKFLISINPFSI
jgi:2-oxoglutarate dehydrogenase E1 component